MTVTPEQSDAIPEPSNGISADDVSSIIVCAKLCRQSTSIFDNEIRVKTLSELIGLDKSWLSLIVGYIVSLSFIDFHYFLNSSMLEKQRFLSYLKGKNIVAIRKNDCMDCLYANDCNFDREKGCGVTVDFGYFPNKGESND